MPEIHSYEEQMLMSGYDDNRITLLPVDPHWLYAYWEISEERKKTFYEDFGVELWEKSVPVLKVTNVTRNESFFIRINDFSDNWYINVQDPNCIYVAEIGRRVADRFFINIVTSNSAIAPGDSMSSNTSAYFVNYRDLKNGRFDPATAEVYEASESKFDIRGILGLSSPELFGMTVEEAVSGVSSIAMFGAKLREHIGISSESLMK